MRHPSQLYSCTLTGRCWGSESCRMPSPTLVEGNGMWVAGCRNDWVYAYSVGDRVGPGWDRLRVAATVANITVAYPNVYGS